MSYPEINQENIFKKNSMNDNSNKSDVCLFNFSNLKSGFKLTLSENNSFNYDLSKVVQHKLKNEKKDISWQKDISRYIKKANIDLPSPKKLLKIENRNKFMNDYNDSFAQFCGLSKDLFIEICINNQYKPKINEFGDISVSIKNLLEILNNFSSSKRLKMTRRMHKKNKKKKIKVEYLRLDQNKPKNKFVITRVDKKYEEVKEPEKENENIKLDSNYDNINKDKTNNENSSSITSKNDSQNSNKNENKKGKSLLNIKKKLKNISIPTISSKEKSVESSSSHHIIKKQNLDSNNNINNNFNFNNNIMNLRKDSKKIASANFENRPFIGPKNILSNQTLSNNLEPTNNNIFNFSSNIIQNYSNNSQTKNENDIFGKPPITPFNENNNNNDLNMSLNHILNDSINRPMLSPLNFPLEYGNIVSPNIYHFPKNQISPFLQNVSPFNNNDMREYFVFNNNSGNNSSFLFENNINENSNNNGNFINIKNNSNNDNNKEILNLNEQNMNINDKKENNINKNN